MLIWKYDFLWLPPVTTSYQICKEGTNFEFHQALTWKSDLLQCYTDFNKIIIWKYDFLWLPTGTASYQIYEDGANFEFRYALNAKSELLRF